jgi:hypothetical protein
MSSRPAWATFQDPILKNPSEEAVQAAKCWHMGNLLYNLGEKKSVYSRTESANRTLCHGKAVHRHKLHKACATLEMWLVQKKN